MTRWRHGALTILAAGTLVCGACRAQPPTAPADPARPAPASTPPPAPIPRFEPTAEVVALTAAMSEEGKRLFYDARPQVLDKAAFATVCPDDEHANVLGCYTGEEIYILRVSRPELAGVMETTAVHEMLHAAYAALPSAERSRVDTWLAEAYARVKDPELRELVASYDRSEPGQRLNELHSILPTQLAELDPRLEEHYHRYLVSRPRVVAAYQSYRGTLEQLERRIKALHAEIRQDRSRIEVMEARIKADQAALDELNRRLEALKASGDVDGFNRLIPQQNARARALNELSSTYGELVKAHNAKVAEVNGLALEQNQLVDSLGGASPAPP